jgi:hypothetical protein
LNGSPDWYNCNLAEDNENGKSEVTGFIERFTDLIFTPKLALTTTTLSLSASNSPPPQLKHKSKPKYLLPRPSYLKATQFLLAQDHNLNVTASNQLEVRLFNMEEN